MPAAAVLAGPDHLVETLRARLVRPAFRLYLTDDVVGVEIVARGDCCLAQSQNLYVSISAEAKWLTQNTPCVNLDLTTTPLKPTTLGQKMTVLGPLNTTARYVNVQLQGTGILAVQEITPFIDGGACVFFVFVCVIV